MDPKRRKIALATAATVLALAGGLFAYDLASAHGGGNDCSRTIVCPLTGEAICEEECPLRDRTRPDCPGKIECPLTGELVCRDRRPLGSGSATEDARPSCCRGSR